jgi:hypothetical protein
MFRQLLVAAALLSAAGCAASSPSETGAAFSGPEVQSAAAACEPKYASHVLTSWTQVAECERDLALPQEQQHQPWLSGMYEGLWRDKIELYGKVDRGELSKPDADRKIGIEADNWLTNIKSVRRI